MTMPQMNKHDKQHLRNLAAYERKVDEIYKAAVKEAAALGMSIDDIDPSRLFSFSDYPITRKRIENLLDGLKSNLLAVVVNGIKSEWTLANNKNNELSRLVLGGNVGKLTQAQYRRYFSTNGKARDAFLRRKENGLNLSDRVWNYTEQFKNEIEMGLDVGIRNGLSADEIQRELQMFLKHPDMLFRRVRDERGQLVLSQRAKEFHPGRGVYRSSYKNARRLAATETNIAYRTADYLRWQDMDFVVGIEVKLSNNHNCKGFKPGTFSDICDELAGKYPKDFKFTGWHPHCRCHAEAILKTEEELMADNERILNGEEPAEGSVNEVSDVPKGFEEWMEINSKRIDAAGSVPCFMKDNPKYTGVKPKYGVSGTVTGTKLGRSATKEAFKEYESGNPTELTKEQKEQITEIAREMGLKSHAPMTFFEADEGRANMNYGKAEQFEENCQCCVAIHEARLRGLNLTAIGYSDNPQSITYLLGENFQNVWINAKTGKIPQATLVKADNDEAMYAKINKILSANGRYHIGVNFIGGKGHVFTAERLQSGKLLFYDPQNGAFLNIREFTDLESFEVLKVDKLLFNKGILRAISKVI